MRVHPRPPDRALSPTCSTGPKDGAACLTRVGGRGDPEDRRAALTPLRYYKYRSDTLSCELPALWSVEGNIMFNQTALLHTKPAHWSIDVTPVVAALHRGSLALGVLRPTRRFAPPHVESYIEAGIMKRELRRL